MVTVTREYFPTARTSGQDIRGSHIHFLTTDLKLVGKKILFTPDVPSHIPEDSLQQLSNGDILMFTASSYFYGNLMALRFDKDWNFIERHDLPCSNAFFPISSVAYEDYWLVAYGSVLESRPKRAR